MIILKNPSTIDHRPLTILVTGGAGYIGSMTTKALLDDGFNVVVLDSLENGHKEAVDKRAVLEVANLEDQKSVENIFEKYKIDAVIDFAAYLAVGESMEKPKKYLENNVFNFVKLLDTMTLKGCKNIIKSSTAATYGNPPSEDDFPLKENYQEKYRPKESALLSGIWEGKEVSGEEFFQNITNYYQAHFRDQKELLLSDDEITKLRIPTSIYGLTKLLDEILMNKYNKSSGINWIALRYFNVCGADPYNHLGEDKPNPTTLMTMTIRNLMTDSKPLSVFGDDYPTPDGTGIRDYIHPLDLALGHIASLKYLIKNKKSDIFNLGCGKGYSVLEVIKEVEKASKQKVNFKVAPKRSGDPAVSYADPTKADKILGWKAKLDLKDMAESAWKWHSENPKGYDSLK